MSAVAKALHTPDYSISTLPTQEPGIQKHRVVSSTKAGCQLGIDEITADIDDVGGFAAFHGPWRDGAGWLAIGTSLRRATVSSLICGNE